MMKFVKKLLLIILFILLIPYHLVNFFIKGFRTLSLFLSRGFYFYLEKLTHLFSRFTKSSFCDEWSCYLKKRQEQPSHLVFMIASFLFCLSFFDTIYVDNKVMIQSLSTDFILNDVIPSKKEKKDNPLLSSELSLYRYYGKFNLADVQIEELKKANEDTVAWLTVEGTNINYPIVQASDNDYYLTHSYDHSYTYNGWTFMDYRNDPMIGDTNTILYGHNLYNNTAFGSISNLFKNHESTIQILLIASDQTKYVYQVFSAYEIDPEIYYLQTNFYNEERYSSFLETIRNRNVIDVDNTVGVEDKILTLSTCTDDNKGRRVVHAKLIRVE